MSVQPSENTQPNGEGQTPRKNNVFVHLHLHTEYSLLDGAAKIQKAVLKAKAQGAPAIAMTDHGNMYGALKFTAACEKEGLKPILGTEFYITENRFEHPQKEEGKKRSFHLILIAKNLQGYKNLCKLNSIAFIDGFYYNPRIDFEVLEQYKDGLICLSACLAGAIPQFLLLNDWKSAEEYALRLKRLFGDDFYIELQNHEIPEELAVLPLLRKLADKIGVKCVATNDVHYVDKSDSEMHRVLVCMQTLSTIDNPQITYKDGEFYMRDYDEMLERIGFREALDNTVEIAEKCNVKIPEGGFYVPVYQKTGGLSPVEFLRKITYEGLERRYGKITDEIRERAEMELEVIISMKFENYFLIVWDYIRYAKDHGIPVGPGRGSGAGSIVAYAIGITDVIDPLKYGLIFERFLNKDRQSFPDFDVDFCYNRRQEVIDYVKREYGAEKTCQIITFGKMKKKQAFRDVCRVYNIPYKDASRYTKFIIEEPNSKTTLKDLITPGNVNEVPELTEIYQNDPTYKKILDIAIQVENFPRNTGVHAAGVVICSEDISDHIPLAKTTSDNSVTTQYDKNEIEPRGLIKMDFLGLKTLTDIQLAKNYIKRYYDEDVDFEKLGYDDPKVYQMICSGDLETVFQLESSGMKKLMSGQLRPTKFEEIIAGIALYRPGPMDYIPIYCANKQNPSKITYLDPRLEPILKETYGVIVYQEQAMFISRVLSGFTFNQADDLRSIIAKKKKDKIPKLRQHFIYGEKDKEGNVLFLGAVNNGVSEQDANALFDNIEKFGSYAFNKSHAAAYAELTYETAWLHCYYPIELVAAVINNRIDNADEVTRYMKVLKEMGVKLLPPDINESEIDFLPDSKNKTVRYGLCGVKNVGKTVMEVIVSERKKNGKFLNLGDFIRRANRSVGEKQAGAVNKRMIESLIKGGAFDCFGKNRATMLNNYEQIMAFEEKAKRERESGQFNFFDMLSDNEGGEEYEYRFIKEYNSRDKLNYEKEMLGMYVTGHPLEGYEEDFKNFNFNTSMIVPESSGDEEEDEGIISDKPEFVLQDGMDVTLGGIRSKASFKRTKDGKEFGVFELEDLYGKIEVCMFGVSFLKNKKFLTDEAMEETDLVKIKGRLSVKDGDRPKIVANQVTPWNLAVKEEPVDDGEGRTLYFNLVSESILEDVELLFRKFPGKAKVRMQSGKQLFELPFTVGDLDALATELSVLIGTKNILVK